MLVQQGKLLSELSTFGIGGPARFYVSVTNREQLRKALLFAKKRAIPFFILGKGSNILFDDKGYEGIIIHNQINYYSLLQEEVTVSAGYSFSRLGLQTAKLGLYGLAFASG